MRVGLALLIAMLALPAAAAPHPPQGAIALMNVEDVLRAMACPPPLACKPDVPPQKPKQFRRKRKS